MKVASYDRRLGLCARGMRGPSAGGRRPGRSRIGGRTRWRVDSDRCRRAGKVGSRPISRVLSWTAIPLGVLLPARSSSLPGSSASHAHASLFGLAPDGVCRAVRVTTNAVSSYLAVSPLPDLVSCLSQDIGGLLSVALSVTSRCPVVNRHPALWSPDFPLGARFAPLAQRLPGRLPKSIIRPVCCDPAGIASGRRSRRGSRYRA